MSDTLVLASGSSPRRALLLQAGLTFEVQPAQVDERAIGDVHETAGTTPDMLATLLATAKAADVSQKRPDEWVIGCDQTLSLGQRIYHKSSSVKEAAENLAALSGKTHHLNSAVVLVRAGAVVWSHVGIAKMTMRPLSPAFIDSYLGRSGDRILSSVGGYQLEGLGVQLFDRIDGDYFTVLGLPLLPLLAALRRFEVIDG